MNGSISEHSIETVGTPNQKVPFFLYIVVIRLSRCLLSSLCISGKCISRKHHTLPQLFTTVGDNGDDSAVFELSVGSSGPLAPRFFETATTAGWNRQNQSRAYEWRALGDSIHTHACRCLYFTKIITLQK